MVKGIACNILKKTAKKERKKEKNILSVWTVMFSMSAIQTVAAWSLDVHRQAAAGHSSQATIGQGQSQGSQKKHRYDLRPSTKPRTEDMNII